MEKVLHFLRDLAANNNKEWFHDNRSRYEESRDKVLFLTEVLINEIRKFDPDIPAMNPKDCMFRIFRMSVFQKINGLIKPILGVLLPKEDVKVRVPVIIFISNRNQVLREAEFTGRRQNH